MASTDSGSPSDDAIRAFCGAAPDGAVTAQFLCDLKQFHGNRFGISYPKLSVLCSVGLRAAVRLGLLDVVRCLCGLGVDPVANCAGLKWAAGLGQVRIAQYLCELPTADFDFAQVLRMKPAPPAPILEAVHAALARQQRWTPGRAAWAGAVAAAAQKWT